MDDCKPSSLRAFAPKKGYRCTTNPAESFVKLKSFNNNVVIVNELYFFVQSVDKQDQSNLILKTKPNIFRALRFL